MGELEKDELDRVPCHHETVSAREDRTMGKA
jgi:hypothetical protein